MNDADGHYAELARELKARREAAGVSLRLLAVTTGYTHQHIHEIEEGRRPCTGNAWQRLLEGLDQLIRTSPGTVPNVAKGRGWGGLWPPEPHPGPQEDTNEDE